MENDESTMSRGVQCQKTRLYLPGRAAPGETIACPWCPEHEQYRRAETQDEAALAVASAVELCRREFGVDDDGIGTAVWLGEDPETVYESQIGRYNIYLGRDSDRWQILYSGGHEAFHRVCSPGVGGHWGDELFAVLFSLVFLRDVGESAHAERIERQLIGQADLCAPHDFFDYAGGPLPGMYGRAFLVGRELVSVVGWERAKQLAVTRNGDGRIDPDTWLTQLQGAERRLAQSALEP